MMTDAEALRKTLAALSDEQLYDRCVREIEYCREARGLPTAVRDACWGECIERGRTAIYERAADEVQGRANARRAVEVEKARALGATPKVSGGV